MILKGSIHTISTICATIQQILYMFMTTDIKYSDMRTAMMWVPMLFTTWRPIEHDVGIRATQNQ